MGEIDHRVLEGYVVASSYSKTPFFFPLGKNKNYWMKYFWLLRCHYETVMMSFQTVFHGISLDT